MENKNFIIRRANIEDIPVLCALEEECFALPWSERSFMEFFALPYTAAFVAETSKNIVCGYAGMYVMFGDGEITNIAVSRNFRRQGIGFALLDAFRSTDGLKRLLLEVRVSNLAARAMYQKYGFTTDCVRRNSYSHPTEDAILMSFNLTGEKNADIIL